jgi:AraC-like DNA-binding protein
VLSFRDGLGKSLSSSSDQVRQGLLIPIICRVFQDLRVTATLFQDGHWPAVIHREDSLLKFEEDYGLQGNRYAYNRSCFERVRRTKSSLLAEHAGLSDLFVPIIVAGKVEATLTVGPFMTAHPSHQNVLERWRALSGGQGHHSDPKFVRYLSLTWSTLVLEGGLTRKFQRLLKYLAALIAQGGAAEDLRAEVETLMRELEQARFAERLGELIRQLLDERTSRAGSSVAAAQRFTELGVSKLPEHVAVGLIVSRRRDPDFVEELLRCHAFQRACVELGRQRGDLACGALGDHGVVFLVAGQGAKGRRRLVALIEEGTTLASRRFGLKLHLGVSTLAGDVPLQYQAALTAADAALSDGEAIVFGSNARSLGTTLARLRRDLARLAEEKPEALPARYEHFIEAVALRESYGFEAARVHLEVAFERMTEPLLKRGTLEAKDFDALSQALRRASDQAATASELFAVHRRAALDIVDAIAHPDRARHDRSLRRAQEYLLEHYTERVSLKQIAHVAGFAPNYFSELFRQKMGQTFADHMRHLRLERAKHLLGTTALDLQRVAEISGLSTRQYLIRAFKRWVGSTPGQYRALSRSDPTSP